MRPSAYCLEIIACLCLGLTAAAPRAVAQEADTSAWFEFKPANDSGPSVIGMEDWLDKPAGASGRITREGEKLLYAGKPLKLWGLNLCYSNCAPDKALADKRAAFYAKFGVNSVRLHKYVDGPGWAGIQSAGSCVEFDPAALDRMDYQVAQFKKAGIYVLLSAHFGALKLGPADKQYVPFLDELGKLDPAKKDSRITTPHSAVHYSPELQDVQIRQMTNLLKHKNPYTGLTYAQDPAVAFIEIINEQSIMFYTTMAPLKASPTIRKQTAERFCDWLRKKYGSHDKLAAAWGDKGFGGFEREGFTGDPEHLDQRNILPLGNPWYWDPAQIHGSQAFRKQRLLDSLAFLYELQCGFYDRYVKAMRDAGYSGEILSTNWQAGRGYSHFANLHSDYRVGTIDRHNYFGGGSARAGQKFNNASMLRVAGSELLSCGLQQATDRPFMLSEWVHVFPNEWGVEGPAILGAYGLGLQGWDVSYMFQNGDSGGFSERIGRDQWDVTSPQVLGVFPAVARQVLRGDVKQAETRGVMSVHVPSLFEGKLGFTDRTTQAYDLKGFDCDKVPARALAVTRCAVEFADQYQDTPAFDLSPFDKDGVLTSSTGELRWKEGKDQKLSGYFTMDTPASKAVVGFAEGVKCALGEVTITPQCRFGAIYVTAKEKDATIKTAKQLVVVALARARNTGMKLNAAEDQVLDRGKPPILLEPVKAMIALTGRDITAVYLLDHDGRKTDKTLPVQGATAPGGVFTIDGARDKALYYEVVLW